MSESKQFILRKVTGDQTVNSEQEVLDWFQKGQSKPGDFLFDFSQSKWFRVGDHPSMAGIFSKPTQQPEKRLIYIIAPGPMPLLQGPFSLKEMQQKSHAREVCENSWIFVEGDKEWRQVRTVKALSEILLPFPTDNPGAIKKPTPHPMDNPISIEEDSISLVTNPSLVSSPPPAKAAMPLPKAPAAMPAMAAPPKSIPVAPPVTPTIAPAPNAMASAGIEPMELVEKEEQTMAFSMLGLALEEEKNTKNTAAPPPSPQKTSTAIPSPPPSVPKAPPAFQEIPAAANAQPSPPGADKDQGSYDGLTAEIPGDPIWMIKPVNSEMVSGPFRFLDVVKFLEQGKISKNDKISKQGTNRFVKIQQQYEFNVKFSLETVIEHGVEKQKILIRRRHPRVPYIADVQVMSKLGLLTGSCVNISAGGILMELPKAEFNLGDIIEVKILPAIITKPIFCKSMVIGRIPKIPPAFALKFEDLKKEDKEVIEFYVQEALKRESP